VIVVDVTFRFSHSITHLYIKKLIALDVFKTEARVDEIHRNINLNKFDLPDTGHPDVPSLFLMNVQFPREQAKVFGDGDGATCSVVFYFRITDHTMNVLKGPASSRRNALKLLAEWCKLAPDDINFRGRFKVKPTHMRERI
jgi:hypothetical protein